MTDGEIVGLVSPALRKVSGVLGRRVRGRSCIHDHDDLFQLGLLEAIRVAAAWSATGGLSLKNYCVLRARGAMLDAIRHQCRRQALAPMEQLSGIEKLAAKEYARRYKSNRRRQEVEQPLHFLGRHDPEPADTADFDGPVRRLGAVMDRRDRAILADYYGRGLTLKQVGRRHRLTESGAHVGLRRAVRSVKLAVAANGLTRQRAAELLGIG